MNEQPRSLGEPAADQQNQKIGYSCENRRFHKRAFRFKEAHASDLDKANNRQICRLRVLSNRDS